MNNKSKILISACLLGQKVRYDAKDCLQNHARLQRWIEDGNVISLCPEIAGGLPTPRPPAEIQGGLDGAAVLRQETVVLANTGTDVSAQFILGAQKALALAQKYQIRVAILKAKSPSCGNAAIYDGHFSKNLIAGMGVAAALLSQHGILVFNENEIDAALDAAEGL